MLSGQSLSLHGEGLKQFVLANFCQAVLLAPIKVRDQPIGLLCVGRAKPRPFTERDQAMLEAVADYASISLVNARLFKALEARARRLEEVVSQSQGTVSLDPAFWGDLERRLHNVRDRIIALRAASPSLSEKRDFEALMAEVDGVLERVRAVQEIGASEPQPPMEGPG
jgi:GAF domain-containing protein